MAHELNLAYDLFLYGSNPEMVFTFFKLEK